MCKYNMCNGTMYTYIYIYIYTRSADLTLPLTHSVIRLQSVRGPRDSTSTLEALAAWKAEPHGG